MVRPTTSLDPSHASNAKFGTGSYEDRLSVCLGEVEVALLKAKPTIQKGVSIDTSVAKSAIDRFAFDVAGNNQVRMSSSVHCLRVSVRVANALERAGYRTVGSLVATTMQELLTTNGRVLGKAAIADIRTALAEHSMCLRGDLEGAKEFRTMDPEILLERERNSQGMAW